MKKEEDFKISLIIPAYNEEKYIGDCLDYAIKNSNGKFFEIIVVDNASTDKTVEILKKYKDVRVIREEHKGVSKARQRGFIEAKGNILVFIDSDCRIGSLWLEKILKEFNKDQNLVALSGPYKYFDLSFLQNIFANLGWWLSAPIAYRLVGYMVLGGNFVVKKEILNEIGGFDTNISFYGDDTNLARRLSLFGKVKFKMNLFVYTSGRRLLKKGLLKTFWVYGINFLWEVLLKKPLTKSYEDIR